MNGKPAKTRGTSAHKRWGLFRSHKNNCVGGLNRVQPIRRRALSQSVCPHSLRGLHSSLAVKAGATSTYVAQALGHGSDAITLRHYIAPSAMDSARSARVSGVLLGDPDVEGIIGSLRHMSDEQLERVCAALGLRRG